MRRKFDRLDAVVTLLSVIVVILIAMILTGCMTAKGLHQENSRRNDSVRWQAYYRRPIQYRLEGSTGEVFWNKTIKLKTILCKSEY